MVVVLAMYWLSQSPTNEIQLLLFQKFRDDLSNTTIFLGNGLHEPQDFSRTRSTAQIWHQVLDLLAKERPAMTDSSKFTRQTLETQGYQEMMNQNSHKDQKKTQQSWLQKVQLQRYCSSDQFLISDISIFDTHILSCELQNYVCVCV